MRTLLALAAAVALVAAAGPARAGLTFNANFTGLAGDGTGNIDLATDPGIGTFAYSAVNPTFTFTVDSLFGTATFDQTGLVNDPATLQVIITDLGGGQLGFAFSDYVYLLNASGNARLTLDPSGLFSMFALFGPGALANLGDYSAATPAPASVPEPSLVALAGLGLAGAGAVTRRFRRKTVA